MDAFIAAQLQSVLRTPNVPIPRPAGCLLVKKVAARSPAAHLGVAEKDLLSLVDGAPASRADPDLYKQRALRRTYSFYSRPRHERIEAVVTGIEIGVVLGPTVEGIKASFDPGRADYNALEALWEARDWPTLEALTAKCIQANPAYRETPVFLFRGAALWEQKRHQEAVPVIDQYLQGTAPNWTMNFTGIGLLYHGLERLRTGDREKGLAALRDAWQQHQHCRIADAMQKSGGERPEVEPPRWVGKALLADYALPRLEGGQGTVTLRDALARLQASQLFAVCLLANYRGNGPYNDFMARYHNYATHFGRYLAGLHVITMEPERSKDRRYYYDAEDEARAARLPVEVLLDEDGAVTEAVGPPSSPFILLLDGNRRVVYEGELSSVDLWDALSAANPR